MTTAVLERTTAATEEAVRHRIHGHWGGTNAPAGHVWCACPTPPASIGARLGPDRSERLVDLTVRFAHCTASPGDIDEMLALHKEAMP